MLTIFKIDTVNKPVFESALAARLADFEDAVIHGAARHEKTDAIVTRDRKDYQNSRMAVYTSEEMAKILAAHGHTKNVLAQTTLPFRHKINDPNLSVFRQPAAPEPPW